MTDESVEQAALARAPVTDPRVVAALESMSRIVESDGRIHALLREAVDAQAAEIETLHAENAELRDGLLALSNRIEAATRNATMSERPCPSYAVVHEPHVYRRGQDVFLCLGVLA